LELLLSVKFYLRADPNLLGKFLFGSFAVLLLLSSSSIP